MFPLFKIQTHQPLYVYEMRTTNIDANIWDKYKVHKVEKHQQSPGECIANSASHNQTDITNLMTPGYIQCYTVESDVFNWVAICGVFTADQDWPICVYSLILGLFHLKTWFKKKTGLSYSWERATKVGLLKSNQVLSCLLENSHEQWNHPV